MSVLILLLIICNLKRTLNTNLFVDRRVEIVDCATTPTFSSLTDVRNDIHCIASSEAELKLGTKSQIGINSVTFTTKPPKMEDKICKDGSTSTSDYKIKMKSDVKSIVYTKDSTIKAILVGSTTEETCAGGFTASDVEIKTGKLVVTSIKCIKKEKVPYLKTGDKISTPKQYHELGTYICFLAPMLKTPLKTIAKLDGKEFNITISSYPIEDCPICPNPKPEMNSTQTAAASSTGMIVGIVVAVLIVLIGGIGFVMMKK